MHHNARRPPIARRYDAAEELSTVMPTAALSSWC